MALTSTQAWIPAMALTSTSLASTSLASMSLASMSLASMSLASMSLASSTSLDCTPLAYKIIDLHVDGLHVVSLYQGVNHCHGIDLTLLASTGARVTTTASLGEVASRSGGMDSHTRCRLLPALVIEH
eukprot:350232-Chlamydomonas_euryale.AAC.4